MSQQPDPWDKVEARVANSLSQGITADADGRLGDAELEEAPINPDAAGGKAKDGQGGMMPPMMMGGRGFRWWLGGCGGRHESRRGGWRGRHADGRGPGHGGRHDAWRRPRSRSIRC